MNIFKQAMIVAGVLSTAAAAQPHPDYDVLIRGGTVYDGLGQPGVTGDVAIKGDKIVYIGPRAPGSAARTVDAAGKAVSPGFINMLSWAVEDLIADGRGLGDTAQGVTLARFSGKIEACRVHRPALSAAVTWRWINALPTPRPRYPSPT